ncbi:MAG TPA: amino acid adenylation domain-containing protein [Longimicrobiaceae bacterium]|nr:amino acid adenylation domain-containing protein [Longimicrobiaceae bacterium]
MSGTLGRLTELSPERRALLQQILRERTGAKTAPQEIRRRETDGPVPLSFAQQRLWFVDQLEPGSPTYNMLYTARLRGQLDAAALRGAFADLVRRHEVLRTVFESRDGVPVQVIRPPAGFSLPTVDLRGLGVEAREAEARQLARREAVLPFDLARGPLLRGTLARLGDAEHVLYYCMHHIASDGWSMGVLVRELAALYEACSRGRKPSLPELPVQYADYAVWQRARLTEDVLRSQVCYWRTRLADAPPVLELPGDRPAVAGQSQRAAAVSFRVAGSTARSLLALGQREGATLYMVVLAAWQLLLSRYSGQDDVVVGTPISGRTRVELEGLIGLFVNMLVMRTGLSGDPTFTGLLGRVREVTLGAYQHQDLPFERLVDELKVERSLAYGPLFQVGFGLEQAAAPERKTLVLGGVRVEAFGEGSANNPHHLDLKVTDEGDGLTGVLQYQAALFDPQTIQRMVEHFRVLVETVAADPALRVSRVAFLAPAEREQVLRGWNATEHAYPAEPCVHDLFAAQAARTPDAPAVVHETGSLTYAALDRLSSQLAHALRRRGVGPESRVGVCLRRTPRALVAIIGALRAGAAYVPLDPAHPVERMGFMLEDARVRLVLTESELAGRIPRGVETLALDSESEVLAREPETAPESGVTPDNLSHVIFTSGSTGRPKGVMVQHRGTVVLLHWLRGLVPAEERESVLGATSFSFDVSIAEVFGTLCWGGRLVLVENALELPSVAQHDVRLVVMVPTAASELLRTGGIPRSVRAFNLAGEALTAELARDLYALGHVEHVRNLYGPTEDTTYSTYSRVQRGTEPVRIGRPVAGSRAYVLDGELNPQPVGVPGELYLAGVGLARGYAARPDLTAERFLPDPYGAPGGRMYRVMDRARWHSGGELEYLGRTDLQVKVRGFRIEPGEIEAALERHPGVHEAVVVAREDVPGEKRLVAYVVPAAVVGDAELRGHLRGSLPEYMVPAAFVALERLPLTASGKIDRRALPVTEAAGGSREHVAPRTPAEEVTAAIWADVLHRERVGATDDFFALGGHSLLATRVVSRIREAFGVELPLRAVFEASTLEGLAERVEAARRAGAGLQAPPLLPVPRDGSPLPLSFAQQRLWFIDQLQPGSAAYNLPMPLRVRGLDVGALERALTAIVRRHETLRTRFGVVDGEPVQVVEPLGRVRLPAVDLARLDVPSRETELERLAAVEAVRPFDLAAGPLLRATAVRLADGDAAVLFTMHHVVSDGWSLDVLTREVSALYEGYVRGEEVGLPELPVQYADYAAWQRAWLSGEVLQRKIGFWRERLAGAPALLELPTDRPRPAAVSDAGARAALVVPAETTALLRALSRREGVTPFMALLAGWQLLLARYSGQQDVVVGSPIAGRNHLETEGLIGFFVNTLVLRADVSGGQDFRGLLRQVRETTLESYQHQEVPFEKLVEELGVERSLAHTPLFQVLFVLQNHVRSGPAPGAAGPDALHAASAPVKFDLALGLVETGEVVVGSLGFRRDLWDASTAGRMLEHYVRVLEGVTAHPERRLSEVSLLGAGERAQVLEAWNATAAEYPRDRCIHELVAGQASRSPGAVAITGTGVRVTYAELERRSNHLAHRLRRRGVGPEVRVGICLDRSVELVVGLLGTLKAGGVYVPLDPGHPPERLRHVLGDAGVRVLLTRTRLRGRLPDAAAELFCLDQDGHPAPGDEDAPPESGVGPESLAYVIYTSGSTGGPKGVMVSHGSLASYLSWIGRAVLGERPVAVPLLSGCTFDASLKQLFHPLLHGGAVWILPEAVLADPPALLEALEGPDAVAVNCVPSLWAALLDASGAGPARGLEQVRQVLLGGEQVSPALVEASAAACPRAQLWNLYGPTEATANATAARLVPGERVSIGRPVANVRAYVLDAGGEPVPVGVPGELCVAGAQVARGYLGRPGLTAERFLPDPFGGVPGGRLYRTGDRVRWLDSGELEFLGRVDQQVKIRGFRIEPAEVEAALRGLAGVSDAAVVARGDAADAVRLVAYVVVQGEVTAEALRSLLRMRLPEYMVPAAFVVLDGLPLNVHGKLDRRALPAPPRHGPHDGYVAPRDPLELDLAQIWEELLGTGTVGVRDSFFELGGHSLLAVRMLARIEQRTGRRLPVAVLFAGPTIEELAAAVRRGSTGGSTSPLVAIRPSGSRPPLFFVHPAGGSVLCYMALSRHLGGDQPFYGLQARGLHPGEAAGTSIESMAADYLDRIRAVHPSGPYRLGGWSMGGVVAFEMARQLSSGGEEVDALVLVDAVIPAGRAPADELTLLHGFALHLGVPLERIPDAEAATRGLAPEARLGRLLELASRVDAVPPDLDLVTIQRLYDVFRAHSLALRAYEPRPYAGGLVLFRASQGGGARTRWERLARGGMEVHVAGGDHFTMIRDPHAPALAAQLSACLARRNGR